MGGTREVEACAASPGGYGIGSSSSFLHRHERGAVSNDGAALICYPHFVVPAQVAIPLAEQQNHQPFLFFSLNISGVFLFTVLRLCILRAKFLSAQSAVS